MGEIARVTVSFENKNLGTDHELNALKIKVKIIKLGLDVAVRIGSILNNEPFNSTIYLSCFIRVK